MERLIRLIGPAPSELSMEDLFSKIEEQRRRSIQGIEKWRDSIKKKKKTARKTSGKKKEADKIAEIKDLLEAMGTSMEELLKKEK